MTRFYRKPKLKINKSTVKNVFEPVAKPVGLM